MTENRILCTAIRTKPRESRGCFRWPRSSLVAALSRCAACLLWIAFLALQISCPGASLAQEKDPLDQYNVVWNSPSKDSAGSMPLGNGDIGLNLWVEADGDLLFYLSKTDAWDEHARLLKLGRVRVKLLPNPFAKGLPFRQELKLRSSEIQIRAGEKNSEVTLKIWVDANRPVVRVEAEGQQPFTLEASLEVWRKEQRLLTAGEAHGVDGFAADQPPFVWPDTILAGQKDRIVWYHRNEKSIWPATLRHQDLESCISQFTDPLLGRTFGGAIKGDGLVHESDTSLKSSAPRRRFTLSIYPLTAQTASAEAWLTLLNRHIAAIDAASLEAARAEHSRWWHEFWNRSWIRITGSKAPSPTAEKMVRNKLPLRIGADRNGALAASGDTEGPAQPDYEVVSQGYARQRFLNACAGRGAFPIKFNGSIFTADVIGQYDGDYRQWGGCYWFQNTRLPCWPMLASGDFDLMQPFFAMYRNALPLAKARTQVYYQHGGAFFPETMYFWGTYANSDMGYGWNRAGEPLGRTVNRYIRFYWSGGLELTAMMLDYFSCTQDQSFLRDTLLPLADEVLEFYARHYPRQPNGKILFAPAQALETWWECENPMPEVAGLRFVLQQLLSFPAGLIGEARLSAWKKLESELPPVPIRQLDGQKILLPAESFRTQQNMENPELYAIFPYRLYGVGKPDLEMARQTFARRQFKGNRGWQQDDTQMAFLGLADEARKYVTGRFASKHAGSRFPAFWGPNFDWIPDQDHGGNGLMALQTMLLQTEGRKILLFPAWPKAWDVEFKLHAPFNTTQKASIASGKAGPVEGLT